MIRKMDPFDLRAQPPQIFLGGLPQKERKHENLPICNSLEIIRIYRFVISEN